MVDLSYSNCYLEMFFTIFAEQILMVSLLPLFGVMKTNLMSPKLNHAVSQPRICSHCSQIMAHVFLLIPITVTVSAFIWCEEVCFRRI